MKFSTTALFALAASVQLVAANELKEGDTIIDGSFTDVHQCANGDYIKVECDYEMIEDSCFRTRRMLSLADFVSSEGNLRANGRRVLKDDKNAFDDLLSDCEVTYQGNQLYLYIIGSDKYDVEYGDVDYYKTIATLVMSEDPSLADADDHKKMDEVDPTLVTVESLQLNETYFTNTVKMEFRSNYNSATGAASYTEVKLDSWGDC